MRWRRGWTGRRWPWWRPVVSWWWRGAVLAAGGCWGDEGTTDGRAESCEECGYGCGDEFALFHSSRVSGMAPSALAGHGEAPALYGESCRGGFCGAV